MALRKLFYAYDGATPADRRSTGFMPEGVALLDTITDDATLPPWMSEARFDEYVQAFSADGFEGPLNWYRAMDLNWSLTAFVQDQKITPPALFIVGEDDPVRHYAGARQLVRNGDDHRLQAWPQLLPGVVRFVDDYYRRQASAAG